MLCLVLQHGLQPVELRWYGFCYFDFHINSPFEQYDMTIQYNRDKVQRDVHLLPLLHKHGVIFPLFPRNTDMSFLKPLLPVGVSTFFD